MPMKNEPKERQRLLWTHDYRTTYERGEKAFLTWTKARSISSHYYSITMTPNAKPISAQRIWKDDLERERYTKELWFYLIQRLNRKIDNNYLRKPHLTIQYQEAVEHYSRDDCDKRVVPHLHATLAVPDACHEQFKALLIETSKGVYTINYVLLKGDFSAICSVQIKDIYDINYWIGYVMKQQLNGAEYEDQQSNQRERYPQDESLKGFWNTNFSR